MLNRLKDGKLTDADLLLIRGRFASTAANRDATKFQEGAIRLFPTNASVDQFNVEHLCQRNVPIAHISALSIPHLRQRVHHTNRQSDSHTRSGWPRALGLCSRQICGRRLA